MRSTVLDMHLLTLARALTEVPPTSPGRQSRLRRLFRVDDSDDCWHERIQQDRSQHLCLTCVHAVASRHRSGRLHQDVRGGLCFRHQSWLLPAYVSRGRGARGADLFDLVHTPCTAATPAGGGAGSSEREHSMRGRRSKGGKRRAERGRDSRRRVEGGELAD